MFLCTSCKPKAPDLDSMIEDDLEDYLDREGYTITIDEIDESEDKEIIVHVTLHQSVDFCVEEILALTLTYQYDDASNHALL